MSEDPHESAGFIIGLDLGQSQDYTALCVVERVVPPLPTRCRASRLSPYHRRIRASRHTTSDTSNGRRSARSTR